MLTSGDKNASYQKEERGSDKATYHAVEQKLFVRSWEFLVLDAVEGGIMGSITSREVGRGGICLVYICFSLFSEMLALGVVTIAKKGLPLPWRSDG